MAGNARPGLEPGTLCRRRLSSAYAFRTIQGFTGSHYIFKLNQRARERGVRFLYDQPVTDLLQDPVSGNVNGVVVKSKTMK